MRARSRATSPNTSSKTHILHPLSCRRCAQSANKLLSDVAHIKEMAECSDRDFAAAHATLTRSCEESKAALRTVQATLTTARRSLEATRDRWETQTGPNAFDQLAQRLNMIFEQTRE